MSKTSTPTAHAPREEATAASIEDLLGYNLKRAYIIVQAHFRDTLGAEGMSQRVFTALSMAVDHPNITQSALARMMGIERSGLVAIVDQLEGAGFLDRVPVPGDRRVQALVPTDLGRSVHHEMMRQVGAHEDAVFAVLSGAERQTLLKLLRKVRTAELK